MFGFKLNKYELLSAVGRGNRTQLQAGENSKGGLNKIQKPLQYWSFDLSFLFGNNIKSCQTPPTLHFRSKNTPKTNQSQDFNLNLKLNK